MKISVRSPGVSATGEVRPGIRTLSVEDYLAGRGLSREAGLQVENQAGPVDYQSAAYYVSLVAEARGQNPKPSLADLCNCSTAHALPPLETAQIGRIGLLHEGSDAPCDAASNQHFALLARSAGIDVDIITSADFERIGQYGGLWIRSLTRPFNAAFHFAQRATQLGIPVIDSPEAILTCGNKVFIAERLRYRGIPMPGTVLATGLTSLGSIESQLEYPMVVKGPDGCFSKSVVKVESRFELELAVAAYRQNSHVVVVQAFMPTEFDWRIAMIDGHPLFACQYEMVKGHWQILHHRDGHGTREGGLHCVALENVPHAVMNAARAAASAMGNGLFGIDLKETPDGVFVIEVNDNPDIYYGFEDALEGEHPWLAILQWFQKEQLKRIAPRAYEAQTRNHLLKSDQTAFPSRLRGATSAA